MFWFCGQKIAGDRRPTCTGLPEAVSLRRREAEARAPFPLLPLLPLLPWWLPFVPLLPFSGLRNTCVVDMIQKYFKEMDLQKVMTSQVALSFLVMIIIYDNEAISPQL